MSKPEKLAENDKGKNWLKAWQIFKSAAYWILHAFGHR
jgi:hypothetical protein